MIERRRHQERLEKLLARNPVVAILGARHLEIDWKTVVKALAWLEDVKCFR